MLSDDCCHQGESYLTLHISENYVSRRYFQKLRLKNRKWHHWALLSAHVCRAALVCFHVLIMWRFMCLLMYLLCGSFLGLATQDVLWAKLCSVLSHWLCFKHLPETGLVWELFVYLFIVYFCWLCYRLMRSIYFTMMFHYDLTECYLNWSPIIWYT